MTEPRTREEASLSKLLAWASPGYPTGAFSYSHGLEWAVEERSVTNRESLIEYVRAVATRGGAWVDAVLFAHAWRAAADPPTLDPIAELATALRGSAETALESRQQGAAFLQVTRSAWPHPLLDGFAARHHGRPVAHAVAMAIACAAHGVALEPALEAYLHAFAANLVSAGARLIPLGQTDAQVAVARLSALLPAVAAQALETSLDDLGTAAPGLELCSLRHETQHTRLFRS